MCIRDRAQAVVRARAVGCGVPALERVVATLEGRAVGQGEVAAVRGGEGVVLALAAVGIVLDGRLGVALEDRAVLGAVEAAGLGVGADHDRGAVGTLVGDLVGVVAHGAGATVEDDLPADEVPARLGLGHRVQLLAGRRAVRVVLAGDGLDLVEEAVDVTGLLVVDRVLDLDLELSPLSVQLDGLDLGVGVEVVRDLGVGHVIGDGQARAVGLGVPAREDVAKRGGVELGVVALVLSLIHI